ncbi:hypothetical protein HHI36_015827 [Cryptolaemus montrouzieri]|uniref:Uncharacterized protein n=1 Tax=Cryptolaemus montrouzieri TaxID=559131 RepID=A0ABD2N7G6_9CUCU
MYKNKWSSSKSDNFKCKTYGGGSSPAPQPENYDENSLDSLANSSNNSESQSDDSHDSDSGTDTKSQGSFVNKCEVYAQNQCGSIRSWTKSDGSNSDCYDYVTADGVSSLEKKKNGEGKKPDPNQLRMETIPEEGEPKISVKEILARFENLKGKENDLNNNVVKKDTKEKERKEDKERSVVKEEVIVVPAIPQPSQEKVVKEPVAKELQAKSPPPRRSSSVERVEVISDTKVTHRSESKSPSRGEAPPSPRSPVPPSGKYSFLQFAIQNFRQSAE